MCKTKLVPFVLLILFQLSIGSFLCSAFISASITKSNENANQDLNETLLDTEIESTGNSNRSNENDFVDNDTPTIESSNRLAPLTNSINNFAMRLIQQLNGDKKNNQNNVAYSPLSIVQAFSMILSSARDRTLEELMTVFDYTDPLNKPENVNDAFKLLLTQYQQDKPEASKRKIKLALPSILLYSIDFRIKRSFRQNLKENYHTEASKIDFSNSQATQVINDFVKKNTNGLITKLIDQIDKQTKVAIVNAFYFKGNWIERFDEKFVKDRPFQNADKTIKNVKTMFKRREYLFFEDQDLQAIKLPYSGNASITIFLPSKNKSIDDLVNNLNSSLIDYYRYQMRPNQVEIYLPKFKVESTINLKEPLNAMGLIDVFSPKANLAGISSFTEVFVSEALHKAIIEINEQGTEAAAATAVSLQTRGISRNMKRMEINHPFIYLIHDELNNVIMFMGVVKKL